MASNNIVKWNSSAKALMVKNPNGFKVLTAFRGLLEFIHTKDWQGACHGSSAVLSVLLSSQGIKSTLCLGEVSSGNIYFDHSWVEVDGEIYDAAISNTLIRGIAFPPVFRSYDLFTKNATALQYGAPSGQGYDEDANLIRQISVYDYMEMFPEHPDGLFGFAKVVGKNIGISVTSDTLRKQALRTVWTERP
ncbi:hypothetical protein JCM14076_23310 [Methylosoma difficile]